MIFLKFNCTFEKSKADLLEKIASLPSRYIGLFRPTKPKAKILQNLLQSHEIRFGDAFERVIEEYFRLKGCEIFNEIILTLFPEKKTLKLLYEYYSSFPNSISIYKSLAEKLSQRISN